MEKCVVKSIEFVERPRGMARVRLEYPEPRRKKAKKGAAAIEYFNRGQDLLLPVDEVRGLSVGDTARPRLEFERAAEARGRLRDVIAAAAAAADEDEYGKEK